MENEVLIGIDIGSTSLRCCLFDRKFNLLHSVTKPTKLIFTHYEKDVNDTDVCWDANWLWDLVHAELIELAAYVNDKKHQVAGLAISSVGCSSVILDQQGSALYPIFRHFTRPSNLLDRYTNKLGVNGFRNLTGYPLAPTSTAFTLAYLKETSPRRFSKARYLLPVTSFIAYKLTHEVTTDLSIGASFGFWDHPNSSWWKEYLDDMDLSADSLGKVVNGGMFIGKVLNEISDQIKVLDDVPVFSGGHDYLCAGLAAGCFNQDQVFNIDGTFEIMASFSNMPLIRSSNDNTRSITDIHVMPNVFSLMVERVGAGQIEWVINLLYGGNWGIIPWDEVFSGSEASANTINENEFFIPYVYGRLFPEFKDGVLGGFLGLGQNTTREKLLKAAIIASCYESKKMFDYQRKIGKRDFPRIVTVGGTTRNQSWIQTKANILGKEIFVPGIDQPSGLGAAMLAAVGSGLCGSFDEAIEISANLGGISYLPDMVQHHRYMKHFEQTYQPLLDSYEANLS